MPRNPAQVRREDWYLRLLWISLACYAIVGKGFAYLGVPPIFVGEVLMLVGLWLWIENRLHGLNRASPAQLLLIGYMLWCAYRTVPGIGRYGADALRDAVVWGYGLFALVVSGLLSARPQRLVTLEAGYFRFAKFFMALVPFTFVIGMWYGPQLPTWPGSSVPLFGPYKTSDTMVHLTGVFAYLSICIPSVAMVRPWMFVAMGANLLANFNGRSGLVAFACGTFITAVLRPVNRLAIGTVTMGLAGVAILHVTGSNIGQPQSERA